MKTLTFALVALGIAAVMAGCGTAAAGSGSASPRGEIELAIYGNDFSLVRESRPVSLGAGLTRLALRDVSKGIDSGSLSFDLRGGGGAQIVSSAYDMGMLARYLMQDEEMRTIVRAVSWQPKWDGPPVWNGNRLLQEYPGADGIKIGYTEASQQTIVGSATDESGRRVIVSLMRSQDRYTDASRLFDWAFAQPSACP